MDRMNDRDWANGNEENGGAGAAVSFAPRLP